MRFLSGNILGSYNNQEAMTASSGDIYNAFSDTTLYPYESEDQSVDGENVSLLQEFEAEQSLDTIVVLDHNFSNLTISIASGGSFTDVTSQATLTNSQNGLHSLYEFDTEITFTEIKFEVSNTSPSNEEKKCGCIFGMTKIGSIERFNNITTKGTINKKVVEMESGGVAVLNKGDVHWEFSITTVYVTDQNEIDVVENIQNSKEDFFFWINDNYDGQETIKQEPYRFEDWIRCAYTGNFQPKFYKNYLNLNANNKMTFKQTSRIDYYNPEL